MNIEVVKNMDPYHSNMLLLLERIAKALEGVADEDKRLQ